MPSGTELRASGQVDAYTNGAKKGISLRLAAIQVINPVSGGSGWCWRLRCCRWLRGWVSVTR